MLQDVWPVPVNKKEQNGQCLHSSNGVLGKVTVLDGGKYRINIFQSYAQKDTRH
ncbi:MAG: hypothetical protein AAGI38_25295 [Bacteroidota bacterium]